MSLSFHPIYGLAAGVYTRDVSRALKSLRHIEAGATRINRNGRSRVSILLAEDSKSSGTRKDPGRDAYNANRRSKSVLIDL
ncbi:aldehyde dehydrogenase family protein [Pannonibacter phragmitetus]|uniref:Aldehyde dehydrogenase n=1 Tax=Pannonibacter phragmitetus TaxID=121719 RepID=A0A0U3NDT7_9HYPH|nr:aldehyde dehydrogenase family protein [Pannonibacter phragmitetus]ALV27776.1 aldehyde dehydrogenase [Pannonibacter phragmitetus]